jgi:hypothetical protein
MTEFAPPVIDPPFVRRSTPHPLGGGGGATRLLHLRHLALRHLCQVAQHDRRMCKPRPRARSRKNMTISHDEEIIAAIRRLIEGLEDRVTARCLLIAIASAPLRMRRSG